MHAIGTTKVEAFGGHTFEFNRVSCESIEVTHTFVNMLTVQTYWTDAAGQLQFGERIIDSKGQNYSDLEHFVTKTVEGMTE